MNATHEADPWGRYRHVIEERLASCADYLSRLQRSLAGEIAPDRHYFNDKAAELHHAARDLVRAGQDVERWLGDCGHLFEVDTPDGRYATECTLPLEHPGEHDDPGDTTVGARLRIASRRLAERSDQVSNHLASLTTRVDQDAALGRHSHPDDREALRDTEGRLRELSDDAAHLAGGVTMFQRQTEPGGRPPDRGPARSHQPARRAARARPRAVAPRRWRTVTRSSPPSTSRASPTTCSAPA